MAGRGFPPKDPAKRARRNADPIPHTTLPLVRAGAPDLADSYEWHPETLTWWRTWQESPLSEDFTATDWSYLKETAVLHTQFWNGVMGVAGELRQRVAKFGATPEDRARLRIFFADASQKESKGSQTTQAAPKAAASNTANLRFIAGGDS